MQPRLDLVLLKATPLSNAVDDNFMIANFIDDMKNDTGLTPIPVWIVVLFSCLSFWCLALAHIKGVDEDLIGRAVSLWQKLPVCWLPLISISYTNIAIDLAFPVLMALAFFSVSKMYSIPITGSRRATKLFFDEVEWSGATQAVLLGYFDSDAVYERELNDLEAKMSAKKIFCVDNLFSGENLTSDVLGATRYVLILDDHEDSLDGTESAEFEGKLIQRISVAGTHAEARVSVVKAMLDMSMQFIIKRQVMTQQSDLQDTTVDDS